MTIPAIRPLEKEQFVPKIPKAFSLGGLNLKPAKIKLGFKKNLLRSPRIPKAGY